jgi:flavin-dependent dehydrogenase
VKSDFEVGIIGASIGGASAAHLLGQAGRTVLLVDKASFPRVKPCGEGLSAAGVSLAKRIGVWAPTLPHLSFDGFKVSRGNGRWYPLHLKGGGGVSIEREHFDHHLISLARKHRGVAVQEGSQASVAREADGFSITVDQRRFAVSKLVLADGARSPIAQGLGPMSRRPVTPYQRNAAATHFSGRFAAQPHMVHILIGPSYELYATPLPGGRLNVAVITNASAPRNPRDLLLDHDVLRPLFDEIQFSGARDSEVLGRAGVGSFCPRQVPPGVFLVGDAREQFDPIGGMGMTHALMSAELAVRSIMEEERVPVAIRAFERNRGYASRRLRRFTFLTHCVLQSSRRTGLILPFASSRLGSAIASCVVPGV